MIATRGYYCLVQYCPDESRDEAANVGVLLFCPSGGYLDAKVSEGNDRVRRFFGTQSFDPQLVTDAKSALVNRLRIERDRFKTQEDLIQFVATRTNGIRLTIPRPVKVFNPVEQLDKLYLELVGVRQTPQLRSELGKHLKEIFQRPAFQGKILHNQEVKVPIAGTLLKAPFAFQNGRLNLICPLTLNTRTASQARDLALDGDLLRKHGSEMVHPASVWVTVARPTNSDTEKVRNTVMALFKDYDLRAYREEQLDELETDVKKEMH